ncbi:MFS transporter [Bacteroidia bacterium]|nr:MFS transporter [Bacteroidia bacterium]
MMEKIKQTLRDSTGARWAALLIVSFTMMWGYFLTDAMAPLMDSLGAEPNLWSAQEFGLFNSAYGWINVFLLMLFFGGLILDKMGVRFTGTLSASLMIIGAFLKYYAIQYISPEAGMILGIRTQVAVACIGFAIFGVGCEITGITVSKVIVKWFQGKELALAMGVQVGIARLGTFLALGVSPILARNFSLSTPLLFALILLGIGLLVYFVYHVMDSKLDRQLGELPMESQDEEFKIRDLGSLLGNRGFWLVALLCVLFYSAVFPFIKFATSMAINKYGVEKDMAGWLPSLLPIGNLILTPLFGIFYDRKGKGATLMITGSFLLVLVHLLFAMPALNYWWFAAAVMIVLGIAFSLVPSAMWPSVPKIIPNHQLGTAYALIFWVQNWGLMGVPYLIGWILNTYCITGKNLDGSATYNYTLPELIFAGFGLLAIVVALLLKAEDKRKGYGLERPNIKND